MDKTEGLQISSSGEIPARLQKRKALGKDSGNDLLLHYACIAFL